MKGLWLFLGVCCLTHSSNAASIATSRDGNDLVLEVVSPIQIFVTDEFTANRLQFVFLDIYLNSGSGGHFLEVGEGGAPTVQVGTQTITFGLGGSGFGRGNAAIRGRTTSASGSHVTLTTDFFPDSTIAVGQSVILTEGSLVASNFFPIGNELTDADSAEVFLSTTLSVFQGVSDSVFVSVVPEVSSSLLVIFSGLLGVTFRRRSC